jgi:hypothetical protein
VQRLHYSPAMTKKTSYAVWREKMGFTHAEAARELDVSESHSKNYEAGTSRGRGNPSIPPKSVRVHMQVIASNIAVEPWPQ